MPKKNLGYLLPAELNPENDKCVIVFIPDTQEDLRALLGSLEGLSQWVNWERTGDNSGAIHAQRWKLANTRTLETLLITDCEFIEELIEDGDMSVNVTNNVSCGGCGGQCGQCPVVTPNPEDMPFPVQEEIPNLPEQTDPGGEEFPDGFADRETYLLHKCRAARELARDIIQTIGNFGSLSGILAAIGAYALGLLITAPASAFVASLLAPLIAIGASVPLAIAIVGSALLLLITTGAGLLVYFNTLQSQLAVRIDEMTCILYQASSGQEARAAMIQLIDEEVLSLVFDDAGDKELFNRALQSILSAVMAPTIFKVLFVAGEALTEWLSERDDGFDCSDCTPPTLGSWDIAYSSGYTGESIVNVTQNTLTSVHANGSIHRGSQFGAYQFRIVHPLDLSINRVSFTFTKTSGDAFVLGYPGGTVLNSNMQSGTYLVAESSQPDEGDFDFVYIATLHDKLQWNMETVYAAAAPRVFDMAIDNWQFTTV